MADDASTVGTSSSQGTGESSECTIEINIKTLDSKIYTFRVNKDMPVITLKAKLVDVSGVPVERQRLIFRGKVLKDEHLLSEYQLEDGHTLHLVARQPIEEQSSSGTGPDGAAEGNDTTAGVPHNRVGHVSHSVLLGTVNMADQGGNIVTDIGRLVGAVLSSLGVGNGAPIGPASGMPSAAAAASTQAPPSAEAERDLNSTGSPLSGNPPAPGFSVINNLFQPQFPAAGFLSRHMTIPDSLTTLSEFIGHMEVALQNGGMQSSPTNLHDPMRTESSSLSARRLPTPDMLRAVMEQAHQLLRGNAAAALSRVATRLEREGTSTDIAVRSQIQAEAMHVGAAMQHLGAMLLELGRATMTLHMGQSPADSAVNSGPAVYISSAGPNPIMVQPFPLQTTSLFGASPTPLVNRVAGSIPTGDPTRNINIHVHSGSPFIPGVSNATARANSGEAVHVELSNTQQANVDVNSTGGLPPTRGLPPRTVVAAIPARPTTQTSGHVFSVIYPVHVRSQLSVPTRATAQVSNPIVSSETHPTYTGVPPSSEAGALSNIVAQISAQVANALAGPGQGLGSLSQGLQSTHAQASQAQPQLSDPTMASLHVSNPTVSSMTHPTNSGVHPPSEAGALSNIVAQISAQVANALAGPGQGLGSLSQGLQATDAQASQAHPQLSDPAMASLHVSNPTVSSMTHPTNSGVHLPSESGALSNIVAQISAQVANVLTGAGLGVGSLSQGLQSTDAQASQVQSGVGSQIGQAHAEANASSVCIEGNSASRMQLTDSSYAEGHQQAPSGCLFSELSHDDMQDPAANVDVGETESNASVIQNIPVVSVHVNERHELPQESSGNPKLGTCGGLGFDANSSANTSRVEVSNDRSYDNNPDSVTTAQSSQRSDSARSIPLGLGLGGLQPKRRGKTAKAAVKDEVLLETPSVNQNQQSIARGQQFLHSLLSQSSDVDGTSANGPSKPPTSIIGQTADSLPLGRQGTNGQGQVDATDMMSQILGTPAFNNLLAGVAEQSGIGSSNDLRSMLSQCTQSPAVRNMLNGITQQVDGHTQSSGDRVMGTGRGQGGLDFSRMIQQMMPAVSQALCGISTRSTSTRALHPDDQTQCDDGESFRNDSLHERNSLDDLGRAVEMIEHHDAPENIFRSLMQSAGHLFGEGNSFDGLVSTLINNEELTNEFPRMLCRDLLRRLQADSAAEE